MPPPQEDFTSLLLWRPFAFISQKDFTSLLLWRSFAFLSQKDLSASTQEDLLPPTQKELGLPPPQKDFPCLPLRRTFFASISGGLSLPPSQEDLDAFY